MELTTTEINSKRDWRSSEVYNSSSNEKAFKRGLIKAASSTGAWIITGGTNTGVMRLVGEAVADEFHTCNLTVLGIATWGKIALREQMIVCLI